MSELSVKRNRLYGPKRENANTVVKDFLVKDSVLPKDDCKQKKTWQTTSDACFGKKTVKLDRTTAKLSTEIQRLSNFEFGSDFRTHSLITTTSFEFSNNVLPPVKRVVPDFYSTNIPDFSHSHKMIGDDGSIYASSFQTSGPCSKATARRRDLQRRQTDDMRSTHFNLGSNKQLRMYSETLHSYHNRCLDNNCIETSTFKKTGPSSVFRSGDWNMSEPCVTKTSVSQHDFSPQENLTAIISRNKFSAIKSNDHSQSTINGFAAKRSTNFKLGSDKCLNSSLYQKDFLLGKSQICPLKLLKPVRLKSSKFLQQTPGMVYPKSTKESNFVYKQDETLNFLKSRLYEFERNQDRHKVSCVVLSDEQELRKPLKQVSMTFKDYQEPSADLLCSHKLQRRPVPKYDYILLDKGLIQPQYETTQEELHKACLSKSLDANSSSSEDCNQRSRDDHKTHFALGSDYLSTVQSEQHDQFTKKTPFDPCYLAAGNNRQAVVGNNNIFARDDNSFDGSLQKSSVMKTDYQPSTKQRVSSAQRRLLALSSKNQPEVMPSHYFHMNHGNERTLSTTTIDYIPPELMAGQTDILTR